MFSISPKTIARWSPGALLAAVAFTQIALAYTSDLTPWKGGGFGMFSSVDYGANRRFLIEGVDANGGSFRVNLFYSPDPKKQDAMNRRDIRLRIKPDWSVLRDLAEETLGEELVEDTRAQIEFHREKSRARGFNEAIRNPAPWLGRVKILRRQSLLERFQDIKKKEKPASLRLTLWRLSMRPGTSELGWTIVGDPLTVGKWPRD